MNEVGIEVKTSEQPSSCLTKAGIWRGNKVRSLVTWSMSVLTYSASNRLPEALYHVREGDAVDVPQVRHSQVNLGVIIRGGIAQNVRGQHQAHRERSVLCF